MKDKIAVIGLGGIGCPAATYLASSGVGHLCLIDFDHVSLSNLNRQVLFSEDDISEKKVEAAKKNLQSLNSEIDIKSIPRKIDNDFDSDDYVDLNGNGLYDPDVRESYADIFGTLVLLDFGLSGPLRGCQNALEHYMWGAPGQNRGTWGPSWIT